MGGFIFEIAGSTVTWSSKKQSTVATSSAEAEYMASANATKEAVWLKTLLKEMDFPQISATIIFADNQGCIALTRNPVNHSRAKHIDIRHHFIREHVGLICDTFPQRICWPMDSQNSFRVRPSRSFAVA